MFLSWNEKTTPSVTVNLLGADIIIFKRDSLIGSLNSLAN